MNLKENLIAYYKFNNSGIDSSGKGHDSIGTENYSPNGLFGSEANNTNKFQVAPHEDFNFGMTSFSLQLWIKIETIKSTDVMGNTRGPNKPGWNPVLAMALNNSKLILFINENTVWEETLSINTWYHLVLTRNDSGELKFYINGLKKGNTLINTAIIELNNYKVESTNFDITHLLGNCGYFGKPMMGLSEEFAIWKGRELSVTEVLALYNNGEGLEI